MIEIEIEEKYLDTELGTSLSLQYENPIFFEPEKLSPGSFSYPFNIPLTGKNNEILGYPKIVENSSKFISKPSTVWFNGVPLKKGRLHVKGLQDNKVSAFFTFGLNNINPNFKTISLREVATDFVSLNSDLVYRKIHTNASQVNIVMNGIDNTKPNWYFRYPNPVGDGSFIKVYPDAPTDDYVPFIDQVSTPSPGGLIAGTHQVVYMVKFQWGVDGIGFPELQPFPCTDPNVELYVKIKNQEVGDYILQPEMTNYYAGFNAFLQPYFNGLLPDSGPASYLRFPFIASPNLVDGKSTPFINQNDGSGNVIVNDFESSYESGIPLHESVNSLQPFLTLKYALDKIATHFDFEYEGDFWEGNSLLNQLIVWNTTSLDLVQKFVNKQNFIFWRRNLFLAELLPDITVVDFFKHLQQSFNLAVYFNETTRKVRLQKRETIANDINYTDITEKSGVISAIDPVTFAAKDKIIPDLVSTPLSFPISNLEIEPIASFLHKRGDSFVLQLLKYEGVKTVSGYTYPYVSNYTLPAAPIWNFMENRMKLVTLKVVLNSVDLVNIDWELKRRFDRVNYLLKSISFKVTKNGFSVDQVQLYTMR